MNMQPQLHQILLQPTDVLFFRDGRPMVGSLAGYAAAWPLPDVTNHALHAALHRAGLSGVHSHDHRTRSGKCITDARKFGSLLTAGPFPVCVAGKKGEPLPQPRWFFPQPKDAWRTGTNAGTQKPAKGNLPTSSDSDSKQGKFTVTLCPAQCQWQSTSSLPAPLIYAVANTQPPSKDADGELWLSTDAYQRYIKGLSDPADSSDFIRDSAFADTEHAIGIAIDPTTGTTGQGEVEGKIYIAHYLRLREGWRLGLFAECMDKIDSNPNNKRDLVRLLFNDTPRGIIVGGQMRLCTAHRSDAPVPLPLPKGLSKQSEFRQLPNGKFAVKWVLLTPAIWPEIRGDNITPHPGGWLPNWVCPETGAVFLKAGNNERKASESREAWRRRVRALPQIHARLVAAIVPKPIAVTGWALPNELDRPEGGAKSTHLAVPAGAVYYFEADCAESAAQLAAALNWHGPLADPSDPSNFTTIHNRRSTLLGEKGYGLGVCGTWQFYQDVAGRSET